MVAVDLDGTLLKSDRSINLKDCEMLKKLLLKNIAIVLASGRKSFEILDYFNKIMLPTKGSYIIGLCGSEILEVETNKIIYKKSLSYASVVAVFQYCETNDIVLEVYIDNKYLAFSKYHSFHYNPLNPAHYLPFEKMKNICLSNLPSKLMICAEPSLIKARIMPDLHALLGQDCTLQTSKPHFLEILPGDSDKSIALKWFCDHIFHCSLQQCASIGDSDVDVGMLSECGYSFCPSNATPEVKRIAKVVLPFSNDECCVGKMIEMYLMKEEEKEKKEEYYSDNSSSDTVLF